MEDPAEKSWPETDKSSVSEKRIRRRKKEVEMERQEIFPGE